MANTQNLKRGNPETQFKKKSDDGGRSAVEANKKSREAHKHNEDMRKCVNRLINEEYDVIDKQSGEVKKFTGAELAAMSIVREAQNPKSRNWAKAVEFVMRLTETGASKNEKAKEKAEIELLKAKTEIIKKSGNSDSEAAKEVPKLYEALGAIIDDI